MQNRLLFVARLDVSAVLHSCLKFVFIFHWLKKIEKMENNFRDNTHGGGGGGGGGGGMLVTSYA